MSRYQSYPNYKDSGIQWLGEVPEHWEVSKLRNIGDFSASGIDKKIIPSEASVRIINYTDVYNCASFLLEEKEYMTVSASHDKIREHQVKYGDLIFTPSSETVQDIGVSALVNQTLQNTAYSYHVLRFRFKKKLFHNFKKYFTNNRFVLSQLSLRARGTTRQTLGRDDFKSTIILLPSFIEQTAIANFLDRETSKIDILIAKQERMIELLGEKRSSLISHTVTKGINPNVSMKDSGVKWLGKVPTHWEIVQSRRLFAERKDRAQEGDEQLTASQKHGIVSQQEFMELEGRRVVQVITGSEILKRAKENDFVISMRSFQGGLEWCRRVGSMSSAYIALIPIKHVIPQFFAYLFKSKPYIQALQSTSNLVRDGQALRFENFSLVDLVIIPDEEQQAIADYLDVQTARIDTLIAKARKAIVLMKERRTALISAAVTGKIDVRGMA